MNNDRLENEKLTDEALENVNGGLDLTIGLPKATDKDRKVKDAVERGKKKRASHLVLKEDSIAKEFRTKC